MAEKLLTVTRIAAERITTLPHRTFARLEAEGVIVPKTRGGPGKASVYDLATIVPAYITHLKAQSARQTEQAARARREQSQAELNELKLAERTGELIDASKAERSWAEHITEARNTLLGVSTYLRTRFPHIPREVFAAVDARIREALEGLSEERGGEKDGDAE